MMRPAPLHWGHTYHIYTHHNAEKHRFVDDYRAWPHSSNHTHLSKQPTRLQREEGLGWSNGPKGYAFAHHYQVDTSQQPSLIAEDCWQNI